MKFAIFAGLGGGFNSVSFAEMFEGSKEEAEVRARQCAIEEYESYEGLHGLRDIEMIMEEDEVSEEEAEEIYNEEVESWIDFNVKEIPEDLKGDALDEYLENLD